MAMWGGEARRGKREGGRGEEDWGGEGGWSE